MSIDPTGKVILFIAADPGVVANGAPVTGQKKVGQAPPYVVVKRRGSTDKIAGPGTDRSGAQVVDFVAFCYALKHQTGEREAFALAELVHDAVHLKGPLTFPVPGGGSSRFGVFRMRVTSIGGVLPDLVTAEPYVPVLFSAIASAQALT